MQNVNRKKMIERMMGEVEGFKWINLFGYGPHRGRKVGNNDSTFILYG